jgi:hypothetical protein
LRKTSILDISFRDGAVIRVAPSSLPSAVRALDVRVEHREDFNGKWQLLRTPLRDCLRAAVLLLDVVR